MLTYYLLSFSLNLILSIPEQDNEHNAPKIGHL